MTRANFMKQIEAEHRAKASRVALMDSYINGQGPTNTTLEEHVRSILRDARDNGYGCWRGFHNQGSCASQPFSLQKRIDNERGDRLYFISMDFWDLGLEFRGRYNGCVSIQPHCQFYFNPRRGGAAIDVKMHLCQTDTLESVEAFYRKFYETMDCTPYETLEER